LKKFLEFITSAASFIDGVVLSAVLRFAIRVYQLSLGLLMRGACRFEPSCSRYSGEAIRRHGAVRGSWLTASRIARCHPFHPGGVDPVP
jgi:putative membrane protein insertion efficiency factor